MSTPTLYLRRADGPGDVDLIYRWRAQVVAWLADRHPDTDQWSLPYPRAIVERWVARGETYMASLTVDGDPVATVTSSSEGDPVLWTPGERRDPARYMSKLTVDRAQEGRGIGETLIAWTRRDAARAAAGVVRIDVWSTNTVLHDYYKRVGFNYLRTVPGERSGALFEIAAGPAAGVLPVVELFDPFDRDGWGSAESA